MTNNEATGLVLGLCGSLFVNAVMIYCYGSLRDSYKRLEEQAQVWAKLFLEKSKIKHHE